MQVELLVFRPLTARILVVADGFLLWSCVGLEELLQKDGYVLQREHGLSQIRIRIRVRIIGRYTDQYMNQDLVNSPRDRPK